MFQSAKRNVSIIIVFCLLFVKHTNSDQDQPVVYIIDEASIINFLAIRRLVSPCFVFLLHLDVLTIHFFNTCLQLCLI